MNSDIKRSLADMADVMAGQSWLACCMMARPRRGCRVRSVVVVVGRVIWGEGE
ncbi:hypothetical protein [Thalassospira marina]|uniref:hypothetical protein n=1 Tax=Thalassospira marina TaxID=2048283 RepID=UPI0013FD49AC|nr:hypothetical protein [Thalassospira marina]